MAKSRSKAASKKPSSSKPIAKPRSRHGSPVARKQRRREVKLAFEALSIEGGLLSPEWLALAAQLQATQQGAADYRIPKGLNLRDEIGRYWRIAQAHHAEFVAGGASNAEPGALATRFALGLLRDCFGFTSLGPSGPVEIDDRKYPIGHAALDGRVPVVIAPARVGLDAPSQTFGDDSRRRSAFGLVQEYLNAADGALWGITTDGSTLRLLRDNASLTRPAWIEADLARMFTEERYSDFAAFWLIVHESRFGRADQPVSECALEVWRRAGLEKGTRAREYLRTGVEEAVIALGQGFLAHVDNASLRAALESGALTKEVYFQEVLRLVYRLIFLLTVEERELLHPPGSDEGAKSVYANGYGAKRLRERSSKRSAHDRYVDLWESLKIVFRGLASGEPRLALPALAGLFATEQCHWLDSARLENRALLLAVFRLSWLREDSGLARVNWRDMGPEELGSVYESLLELVPQVSQDRRTFGFASGDETKGNARKTTGSYYTPDGLVQALLESALEPVVADTIAKHPDRSVDALLDLSIVDPACGSGHFLLAAARRLAGHVARLQATGTPTATEYRHALRQVVGRCIYGVDLNPMAVELCKVSLWMEAVEPGRPLTFLDAHVRCGNSLLGTTPELMAAGIPDAAFDPIEGDDKKIAASLKKRNKTARTGQRELELGFSRSAEGGTIGLIQAVQAVDAAPDVDLGALEHKQQAWQALLDSQLYRTKQLVADAWCAAFVWKKEPGPSIDVAPTHDVWEAVRADPSKAPPAFVTAVRQLAREYAFFHWHLAFPPVFAKGGFDVVLGNPPWDQVQIDPREWFAARAPEIANAQHHAARNRALEQLETADPILHREFGAARRRNEGVQAFVHQSGRYPLTSNGRLNTAPLFAETATKLTAKHGFAALIVPTGIATDAFTQAFFRELVESKKLRSLHDFQTSAETFGNLAHGAFRFCLITMSAQTQNTPARLSFFARTPAELRDPERIFSLTPTDFGLFNPNTFTCPTFRSDRDAALNRAIYQRAGVLVDDTRPDGDPWSFRGLIMFNMSTDSQLFHMKDELGLESDELVGDVFDKEGQKLVPLYEAKMVDHFDHRYASLVGVDSGPGRISRKLVGWYSATYSDPREFVRPQYWVRAEEVERRLRGRWSYKWLLGWRDICRSTDQRTVIASLVPRAATGDTFLLGLPSVDPRLVACLYASLCSFALDYAARQKVGGTHLKYHTFKQLPILPPSAYLADTPWQPGTPVRDWLLRRVLELAYTAWDLESFAHDVGYDGAPFTWHSDRRLLLRWELDAAFFHLYGLSRKDTDYVMDTFPIVRRNDEKAHGEYRTKRVVLEIYDAMADAMRNGKTYRTRLDPGPAERSVEVRA